MNLGRGLTFISKMIIESIKEYFKFTRKERIGILCLSLLVLAIAWLPSFIPSKTTSDPALLAEYSKAIDRLNQPREDSVAIDEPGNDFTKKKNYSNYPAATASFFSFDPNSLDEAGWRKLGVKEKTIGTIKKYLSKGGSFKSASDIHKIYGISPKLAEQLEPWIKIEKASAPPSFSNSKSPAFPRNEYPSKPKATVDINQSDTSDWIAMPGIGPALARRIVLFREKLGGFHSIEQIGETYGLADSVFQLIRPRLLLNESTVTKININTADANRLKQHPYIGWKLANALVKYRETHGSFKSPQDLSQIDLFSPDILLKLMPYLSVD